MPDDDKTFVLAFTQHDSHVEASRYSGKPKRFLCLYLVHENCLPDEL